MTAWLHAHSDAIRQTLRQFWRRPISALFSAAVIGIGLLFPLGGYIVVANVKVLAAGVSPDSQMSIFLAPDAGAAERADIERRLRLERGVRAFRLVGKDAALKELQARTGRGDLLAGLTSNPLPDTYLVTPREVSAAAQARLADSVRNWPKVSEVDVDTVWTERLRLLAETGDMVVFGLSGVLGLAMLAISFNTIRLQVLTRVEEIAVLRLFGATASYVKRPFLYFGALQGAVAAVFAWAVAGGLLRWVEPRLAVLLDAYGLPGRLAALTLADGLALVGFSALVGVLGAWLASGER